MTGRNLIMTIPTPHHAWYSEKQCKWRQSRRLPGALTYSDANGNRVTVTCVCKTDSHACQWDDMVYVGMVSRYPVDTTSSKPEGTDQP